MISSTIINAVTLAQTSGGADWGRAVTVFGIGFSSVFIIMFVLMAGMKITSGVIKKIEAGRAASK